MLIPVKDSSFLQHIPQVDIGIHEVGIQCNSLCIYSFMFNILTLLKKQQQHQRKTHCFCYERMFYAGTPGNYSRLRWYFSLEFPNGGVSLFITVYKQFTFFLIKHELLQLSCITILNIRQTDINNQSNPPAFD